MPAIDSEEEKSTLHKLWPAKHSPYLLVSSCPPATPQWHCPDSPGPQKPKKPFWFFIFADLQSFALLGYCFKNTEKTILQKLA